MASQLQTATLNKLESVSPGMEAAIANLLEPDETIIVGNNGIWVSVLRVRLASSAGALKTPAERP